MEKSLNVLLVEDSQDDILLIERELTKGGLSHTLEVVTKRPEFERSLTTFSPDVILCDHSLPEFNSIEAYQLYKARLQETQTHIPFILVTGNVSEDFAIEMLKAGVDDYVLKSSLKRLPAAVTNALEKCRIKNERKKHFSQVLAMQSLMNEAGQLAHFGSWQADLLTGKHTWSDEIYRIYGFQPGEVEPDYSLFLSMVHPDDMATIKEAEQQIMSNPGSAECEFRVYDRKGRLKYIACKLVLHRDAAGKPIRVTGFNLDITDRKLAEEMMQRKAQEYQSFFDLHPDAIFSLDRHGKITRINQKLSDLTKWSAERLIGSDFRPLMFSRNSEELDNHFLQALQRRSRRFSATLRAASGRDRVVEITFIPIVVNDDVTGVHGIARDISPAPNVSHGTPRITHVQG